MRELAEITGALAIHFVVRSRTLHRSGLAFVLRSAGCYGGQSYISAYTNNHRPGDKYVKYQLKFQFHGDSGSGFELINPSCIAGVVSPKIGMIFRALLLPHNHSQEWIPMSTFSSDSSCPTGKRPWNRPQLTRVSATVSAEGGASAGITEGGHVATNPQHFATSAVSIIAPSNGTTAFMGTVAPSS